MKKSTKIFLALGIVAVVAVFGGILYIEIQTENILKQELAKNHITVEEIDYSHIFNTLEFKNLKGSLPTNPNFKITIEHLLLTSPNLQSFNPQGEAHPTVAEEIIGKNMAISYELTNKSFQTNMAQVHIKGYRQNIGRMTMATNNMYSEDFFRELFNAYYDSFECLDIVTTSTLLGSEKNTTKRTLLKGVTPNGIELYALEDMTTISDQGRVGTFYTDIKSSEVNNIKYPSPQLMSKLYAFFQAQQTTKEQKQELLTLIAQYFQGGMNNNLKVQNFDTGFYRENKKDSIFALKELSLQSQYDQNTNKGYALSLDILGLQANVAAVDKTQMLAIVKSMLKSPIIQGDMSIKSTFHHKNQLSSIAYTFKSPMLGELMSSWSFMLPWANNKEMLTALADNADMQSISQATLTKNMHFSFEDKGLLPRILRAVSELNKMPLEQAEPLLQDFFNQATNNVKSFLTENNFTALDTCLKKPGKLSLDINLEVPTSNVGITWQMLRDPLAFPLKISCTAGENLMELTKKLQ